MFPFTNTFYPLCFCTNYVVLMRDDRDEGRNLRKGKFS